MVSNTVSLAFFVTVPILIELMRVFIDFVWLYDDLGVPISIQSVMFILLGRMARRIKQHLSLAWDIYGVLTAVALGLMAIGQTLIDHPAVNVTEWEVSVAIVLGGGVISTALTVHFIRPSKSRFGDDPIVNWLGDLLPLDVEQIVPILGKWFLYFYVFFFHIFITLAVLETVVASAAIESARLFFFTYYFLFVIVSLFRPLLRDDG